MKKTVKFENSKIWKKSRELSTNIYWITNYETFKDDITLQDQIRGAGNAVMFSIAKACNSREVQNYLKYLDHALGFIAEVQSALYIAIDQKYLEIEDFEEVYDMSSDISDSIMNLIDQANFPS